MNAEAKWTPGPWWTEYVGDLPTRQFATDRPTIGMVGDYRIVSEGRGYDLHGECVADARLIAAAPEMLEALRRADAMIELIAATAYQCGLEGTKEWDEVAGGSDIHGTHDTIRAAIAKAREASS